MSLPWPLLLVLVWDRVDGTPRADLLLGLAGAARMLPYVLLSWAGGMLADRFRRDRLLRLTLVARVLLLAVVALGVLSGWLVLAVLAASAAVACGTPAYPALAAAMPAVAGAGRRRATDLLVTIEVACFVVGPALGGLLLADAARPWLLGLALGCTLVALALVIRLPLPRPVVPARSSASRPTSPLSVLRASPAALRAVLVVAALNAVVAALALVLLPLAERVWAGGAAGYGLAVAVLGLGALGAPLLWWLGVGPAARTRWALMLLAGALVLTTAGPAVGWVLLPLAVAGAASVHVEGAATETIQDGVADRHRAGVLGLTDSVMVGAAMAVSLVTPWLATTFGPRGLLAGLVVLCLLLVLATALPGALRGAPPMVPAQRTPGQVPSASADRRRSSQAATTQSTRTLADVARPVRTPTPATSPASADPREPAAVFSPAMETKTMPRSWGGE
jgi:MFS family permease